MADWTDSTLTSCQDRGDAGWSNDELVPCADRTGIFAYGLDDDTHADTLTRSTSAGWTTIPLASVCD